MDGDNYLLANILDQEVLAVAEDESGYLLATDLTAATDNPKLVTIPEDEAGYLLAADLEQPMH